MKRVKWSAAYLKGSQTQVFDFLSPCSALTVPEPTNVSIWDRGWLTRVRSHLKFSLTYCRSQKTRVRHDSFNLVVLSRSLCLVGPLWLFLLLLLLYSFLPLSQCSVWSFHCYFLNLTSDFMRPHHWASCFYLKMSITNLLWLYIFLICRRFAFSLSVFPRLMCCSAFIGCKIVVTMRVWSLITLPDNQNLNRETSTDVNKLVIIWSRKTLHVS